MTLLLTGIKRRRDDFHKSRVVSGSAVIVSRKRPVQSKQQLLKLQEESAQFKSNVFLESLLPTVQFLENLHHGYKRRKWSSVQIMLVSEQDRLDLCGCHSNSFIEFLKVCTFAQEHMRKSSETSGYVFTFVGFCMQELNSIRTVQPTKLETVYSACIYDCFCLFYVVVKIEV